MSEMILEVTQEDIDAAFRAYTAKGRTFGTATECPIAQATHRAFPDQTCTVGLNYIEIAAGEEHGACYKFADPPAARRFMDDFALRDPMILYPTAFVIRRVE